MKKETKRENDFYRTSDFVFVTYWLLQGHKILGLEKDQSGKVIFKLSREANEVFKDWQFIPNEKMSVIQAYETQRAKVMRTIKNFQNEMKRNGEYYGQAH